MISIYPSLRYSSLSLTPWESSRFIGAPIRSIPTIRFLPPGIPCAMNHDSAPLNYDPSGELLGLDVDQQPRNLITGAPKLRSWFGPNGQYIRELPCPGCRGRGYTPCTECGIERSRSDCPHCNGKGLRNCQQCLGDCVIWEESIDERPWEKARSSSPFKVKEDEEVDCLEIKVGVTKKSKRIYGSPSPEVTQKISRSLRSLNAKTGLFSKHMKIIHSDPVLHAQRIAAIKKAKGTPQARKQASDAMKAFFSNPENRLKRSIAMKEAKYYCRHCGEEGHRKHYCPTWRKTRHKIKFRCQLCGQKGHNRRTCDKSRFGLEPERIKQHSIRHCRACGQRGHNRRTCPELMQSDIISRSSQMNLPTSDSRKRYSCSLCFQKGHNSRTCQLFKRSNSSIITDTN